MFKVYNFRLSVKFFFRLLLTGLLLFLYFQRHFIFSRHGTVSVSIRD